MPIPREQIPSLIQRAEELKIDHWKETYFKEVCTNLQVHTKGQLFSKVDTLFPNEHPDSKKHCLATYEPITKGSIWKGINNLKRILTHSSFSFNAGENLADWLAAYEYQGQSMLNYFVELWVNRGVAEDPNGWFVIYPPDYAEEKKMSPIQFVRSELLRGNAGDFVAFTSEEESTVAYNYEDRATKREVFVDASVDHLNACYTTVTTYNKKLTLKVEKPVVHIFTQEGFISYTREQNNTFKWTVTDFTDTLSLIPVFVAGGMVADEADQLLYESFVSPFISFGNLALLQHRNHRAVDLQFSYPRMSELQIPCDYQGCAAGKVKTPGQGYTNCPKCNSDGRGGGFITVQSPYKVYQPRYDPNDTNQNEHLKVDPVKFFSPDVAIIDYSKDAWKDYLKMAEEAIFIQQRVTTGNVESADSKEIDREELYAWITDIGKVLYNNMRIMLQTFEEYLSPNPISVSVEKPRSLAILTESEAFASLTNILSSAAPILIKANEVENFVNKFVSKDSPVIRALQFLKQYDPLLFYSTSDVQAFKAAGAITPEMVTRHVLAYPLLLRIYTKDKAVFENNSDDQLATMLDAEISTLKIPTAADNMKQSITALLGQGGAVA